MPGRIVGKLPIGQRTPSETLSAAYLGHLGKRAEHRVQDGARSRQLASPSSCFIIGANRSKVVSAPRSYMAMIDQTSSSVDAGPRPVLADSILISRMQSASDLWPFF